MLKWRYVLLVVLVSIASYIWIGYFDSPFFKGLTEKSNELDHFGSYIGGIFSVAAFLIVFIQMQDDRKRFQEEKKEQDAQRRKDEFERTFFMMLEHHNNKLQILADKSNGLESIYTKKVVSLIDFIYEVILPPEKGLGLPPIILSEIRNNIDKMYYKEYSEINSYFLYLFRILKFIIKHEDLNLNNEYSSLLRSFLSKKLLAILAYHLCERDSSYKNYIFFVNEFRFLEHMDIQNIEDNFLNSNFFSINPLNDRFYLSDLMRHLNSGGCNKTLIKNSIKRLYFRNQKVKPPINYKLLRLTYSKINNKVLKASFFSDIDKQSQHLFIYLLSTFDNAFEGNMEYKYIKGRYQVLIEHLKNKNKG